MNKKESFELIDDAYVKIKEVLETVNHGEHHEELYSIHLKEERQHRRGCPAGVVCGLTVSESVRLFYVSFIVEALFAPVFIPTLKDYISTKQSYYLAYSLVENYREELNKALLGVNWLDTLKVNYAELMK
jgi:hypothetical protein